MKNTNIFTIVTLSLLLLFADSSFGQKKRKENPHAPGEDIYKHYTGKIGGKKAVVDLLWGYQGGSNYGGSNYYFPAEDGIKHFSIFEPASFDHGVPMTAQEDVADSTLESDRTAHWSHGPKMHFTISDNTLKGTWSSIDGKVNREIDLKEDYSHSVAFDLTMVTGSSETKSTSAEKLQIRSYFLFVSPVASTKSEISTLIREGMIKMSRVNATDISNLQDLPKVHSQRFAAMCGNIVDGLPPEQRTNQEFFSSVTITPVYNDNDILVLRKEETTARGSDRQENCTFICLDTKALRELKPDELLKDFMNTNKAQLEQLLESAFRQQFYLAKDKKLSTWLNGNTMPVNGRFYPVHKGFIFHYDQGELLKEKPVDLYVSYLQIKGIMGDGFKKRMGM